MNGAVGFDGSRAEAELVAAAAGGDDDAFAQLFRRHADRVRSHLTRLVGLVPERDDLVQKIFLALSGALPSYRGEGSLSTFLHRMTVNTAVDHLRGRKRNRLSPRGDEAEAAIEAALAQEGSLHPEARVGARAELARLLVLLDELAPKKRVAFVLVAVEGHSLEEAAALVGARKEAVKQRVLSARRELLALMRGQTRRPDDPSQGRSKDGADKGSVARPMACVAEDEP